MPICAAIGRRPRACRSADRGALRRGPPGAGVWRYPGRHFLGRLGTIRTINQTFNPAGL